MAVKQFFIAAIRCIRGIQLCRIFVRLAVIEAGSHAQKQRCLIGVGNHQRTAHRPDASALCGAGECSGKENAVPASGAAGVENHILIVGAGPIVVVVVIPSVQTGTEGDHAGLAGCDMDDQHPIRHRHEHLPHIGHIVCGEAHRCQRLFQIQRTLVLLCLAGKFHVQIQIAQRHVVAGIGRHALHLLKCNGLRLLNFLLPQQSTDFFQTLPCVRIVPVPLSAGPDRILVEFQHLVCCSAKYHGTDSAVSDRQCMVKIFCRLCIPKHSFCIHLRSSVSPRHISLL